MPFRAPLVTVLAAFAPVACGEEAGGVGEKPPYETCPADKPAQGALCEGSLTCGYDPCPKTVATPAYDTVVARCKQGRFELEAFPVACNPPPLDAGDADARVADADAGDSGRWNCPAVKPQAQESCSGNLRCEYEWCPFGGHATTIAECKGGRFQYLMASCNPPPPRFDAGHDGANLDGARDPAHDGG